MVIQASLKPTVIVPDATPLTHLAAGEALPTLNSLGRVVVVDIVALEATFHADKPYAHEIAAWLEAGQKAGTNRPVEIAVTELGPLYRLGLEQDVKRPRNAGEIAIAEWLADELRHGGGPALVIYENGRVPAMLAREGVADTVAVVTTRNFLELAEEEGIIPSADEVWRKIVMARPTANPASVRSFIRPSRS